MACRVGGRLLSSHEVASAWKSWKIKASDEDDADADADVLVVGEVLVLSALDTPTAVVVVADRLEGRFRAENPKAVSRGTTATREAVAMRERYVGSFMPTAVEYYY